MLPRSFVVPDPIQKPALTKLLVCRMGSPTNFARSIVPNCLPYLPSNTSRLILISACSASYLVRGSGIGPRYLWFPKSYHHSLPLFLTVKEHHLRSRGKRLGLKYGIKSTTPLKNYQTPVGSK